MNSEAEALGQAATQAPQPMQVGGVEGAVGVVLGDRDALASGAEPVLTEM